MATVSAREAKKQGHVTKHHRPYDLYGLWMSSEMVSSHLFLYIYTYIFMKSSVKGTWKSRTGTPLNKLPPSEGAGS